MHLDIPVWLFPAVTTAAVLMQALVLLGMLIVLRGAVKRLNEVVRKAEEDALPVLAHSRQLLEEISPKLKVAAQNALEVSQTAREVSLTVKTESARLAGALDDLLKRAAVQTERLDDIVTSALNGVAQATAMVQKAVSVPVRQMSAVLNGLRAGLGVLRNKDRQVHAAAADGDHFV